MSEKIRAVVVEESEQEIYQKEVDEKFDKIFKCLGIQNNV